jgi:hypothetical protein
MALVGWWAQLQCLPMATCMNVEPKNLLCCICFAVSILTVTTYDGCEQTIKLSDAMASGRCATVALAKRQKMICH